MKFKAIVQYNGSQYYGWQKQNNATTIQGEIEKVLSKVLNEAVHIVASGRTDAGVHALGQVFHFETNKTIDMDRLRYSLNCLLSSDIHIKSLTEVDDDFHARFNVKLKHYVYRIRCGENFPFDNIFTYNYLGHLDFSKLKDALKLFIGEHNFQSFTSKEIDEENFIRNIVDIYFEENEDVISIHFVGEGFMRYMIRFIIGTAIAYSEDRICLDFIVNHLDNPLREIVSYKAPSNGLTLKEVIY